MFPAKVHGFEEVQFSPKGTVFTKLSSKISPGAFSLSEGIVLYVLGPMLSGGWCSATKTTAELVQRGLALRGSS